MSLTKNDIIDEIKTLDKTPESWPPKHAYIIQPISGVSQFFLGRKQFLNGVLKLVNDGNTGFLDLELDEKCVMEDTDDCHYIISYLNFIKVSDESDADIAPPGSLYYFYDDSDDCDTYNAVKPSYTEDDWKNGKPIVDKSTYGFDERDTDDNHVIMVIADLRDINIC